MPTRRFIADRACGTLPFLRDVEGARSPPPGVMGTAPPFLDRSDGERAAGNNTELCGVELRRHERRNCTKPTVRFCCPDTVRAARGDPRSDGSRKGAPVTSTASGNVRPEGGPPRKRQKERSPRLQSQAPGGFPVHAERHGRGRPPQTPLRTPRHRPARPRSALRRRAPRGRDRCRAVPGLTRPSRSMSRSGPGRGGPTTTRARSSAPG